MNETTNSTMLNVSANSTGGVLPLLIAIIAIFVGMIALAWSVRTFAFARRLAKKAERAFYYAGLGLFPAIGIVVLYGSIQLVEGAGISWLTIGEIFGVIMIIFVALVLLGMIVDRYVERLRALREETESVSEVEV